MKRRILFVDDQPHVLDGLRRMLRSCAAEWDMRFASGGKAALEMIKEFPPDVVVSDMRMPEMDGAELLRQIRQQFPMTVRIVLSGHSQEELVLKAVGPAHRFLSKPCDKETLMSTIEKACQLHETLRGKEVQKIVGRLESLPCLPAVYSELVERLQKPHVGSEEIANVITKDPGMCTKILQLVNSSFFGLSHRVTNPLQAVTYLGVEKIRALVLCAGIFSQFDRLNIPAETLDTLAEHGLRVGFLSRDVMRQLTDETQHLDDAFLAGMLHDLGKLVLMDCCGDEYCKLGEISQKVAQPLWVAERDYFRATHAEIGGYLVGLWGLPDTIVDAVSFHHSPSQSCSLNQHVLAAVHLANAMAHDPCDSELQKLHLDSEFLSAISLPTSLSDWIAELPACPTSIH